MENQQHLVKFLQFFGLWLVFGNLIFTSVFAQSHDPIELWPNGIPGEAEFELPAESVKLSEFQGEQEQRIENVKKPTLTMFMAPKEKNDGTTVLVCPGGGYNILAYSHEGSDVCKWLNSIGINAGLLKYRIPRRKGKPKHAAPLQDVQRAMTIIRNNAENWNLDRSKVGILGFSAGGHLAAMAITSDGKRTYLADAVKDESRDVNCVPNFGILIYAAYLEDQNEAVALSPELKVTKSTPPTFLVVAHDDKAFVEGSARFYIEMLRNNRPAELHVFAKGGHGFGIRKTKDRVAKWPQLVADWLEETGFSK